MLPTTGLLIAILISIEVEGVEFAITIHEFSAFLSYLVIGIHVVASLYSRIKGEGMWNAMVPYWKANNKLDSKLLTKMEIIENKTYEKIEEVFKLH
jgi:hypothetical protein